MAKPNESVRSRTRAAILDAASALFRENGFGRTSMDEIAGRASVARGTLYYNFSSKDDIAIGIAERHRTAGYADLLERKAAGANALVLLDEFFAFAGAWIAQNDATRWPLQLLHVALAGLLAEDGSPSPTSDGYLDAARTSRLDAARAIHRTGTSNGEAVP